MYAGLLPEDKVRIAEQLRRRHGVIMMAGDGTNDVPALAASGVGIAIGTAGNDVAMDAADVALMGSDLRAIPYLVKLSKAVMSKVRTNVAVALGLKLAFIALGVSGLIPLWAGVAGDDGVTLLMIALALPLLRFEG